MGNKRTSPRIDWLATGPLAPYVDAYKQYLTDRGYAATTFGKCIRCVAHFAQWICERQLRIRRIDETVVAEFIDGHLPECRCAGPVDRDRGNLSAALGHLLVVLRAEGAIGQPTARVTPVDEELIRYDEYMDHVRGLAPKTRSSALRIAGRLLVSRFGDGDINIAAIKPDQVRRFFAQQAKLYSKPVNAGAVVANLRGYFRYRASLGDQMHGLIGVLSYRRRSGPRPNQFWIPDRIDWLRSAGYPQSLEPNILRYDPGFGSAHLVQRSRVFSGDADDVLGWVYSPEREAQPVRHGRFYFPARFVLLWR